MVRSVNVKKTKSSRKIVLKITMSMTATWWPVIPECALGYTGPSLPLNHSLATTTTFKE